MTIREYYGYALAAGIQYKDARHMTPGFILDMYVIHTRHEVKMRGSGRRRK